MNLFTVRAKTSILLFAPLLLAVAWSSAAALPTTPPPPVPPAPTSPPADNHLDSDTASHPNASSATTGNPTGATTVFTSQVTQAVNGSNEFNNSRALGEQGTPGTTPQYNVSTAESSGNTTTSNTTAVTEATPASIATDVARPETEGATSTAASSTSAATSSPGPVTEGSAGTGTVILILILLAIAVLAVVLFYLRKKSRSYSFDLNCPLPGDQASDNTPLKSVEMDTFYSKQEADTLAAGQSEVTAGATNNVDSPPVVANGKAEEGPVTAVITLDSNSSKSDHSESGTQVDSVLEDSALDGPLDVPLNSPLDTPLDTPLVGVLDAPLVLDSPLFPLDSPLVGPLEGGALDEPLHISEEEPSGNENNNNITVTPKAGEGPRREEDFTEINLN